tara:strand:+ start:217 stop:501 length:285 start_codon:yes stop_codon:yes gene_type:complete
MIKMNKERSLSKNQQIILDLIDKSSEPLKAYTILFNVQKKGIKAPPQVYRALDKLVEIGKIHRLKAKTHLLLVKILIVKFLKLLLFQYVKAVKK